MRLLAFLLVALSFAHAEIALEGNVMVLDDSNWAEAVAAHPEMLVEFYAPWCGHCKTLAPEWTKAADALKDSSVKLAKVDATDAKTLAKQFEIKGFPTIKFMKKGKPSDYNGGRKSADIISWVNKKSGPATKTVSSEAELLALQEAHDVFVLGVFSSLDSANARAFTALAADDEEDTVYAATADAAVRTKLAVTHDTVVVLKTFDSLRADKSVEDGVDAEEVAEFIQAESTPLVQEFTAEGSKKIFNNAITKHALFFTEKSESHHAPTMETMKSVAGNHKGNLLFINVPSNKETTRVYDYFGITSSDLPKLILADMNPEGGNMKKFSFEGAFDVESINQFATDMLSNKLKPSLKSEEPVPADTAGNVAVIKGKSFDDIVINNENDVLVEFYAPWCGHCKQLAATWDTLGEKYAATSTITIAKMDATANEIDVDGVVVKGFPTIYFFKGGDKSNPMKYEGGRELEDLITFVEENGSSAATASHEEL